VDVFVVGTPLGSAGVVVVVLVSVWVAVAEGVTTVTLAGGLGALSWITVGPGVVTTVGGSWGAHPMATQLASAKVSATR